MEVLANLVDLHGAIDGSTRQYPPTHTQTRHISEIVFLNASLTTHLMLQNLGDQSVASIKLRYECTEDMICYVLVPCMI